MESSTTIRDFLSNLLGNYTISDSLLLEAAESPMNIGLAPFDLDEPSMVYPKPLDFEKRRDYAESCVYYFALRLFATGGVTEKIGNESYSSGSITITKDDRTRFKAMADSLRRKHDLPILEDSTSCISDGSKYMSIRR